MPLKAADPTETVFPKVVVPVAALVWVRAPVKFTVLLKLVVPELVMVTWVSLSVALEPKEARFKVPVPEFNVRVSDAPPAVPSVVPDRVIAPAPTEL